MDKDGNFVVVWESSGQDGSGFGVFARRYQTDGSALDTADIQINVDTIHNQLNPSVAMNADGDFVVVWESYENILNSKGIYARHYRADGSAIDSGDIKVNVYTASYQRNPAVSMDSDGDFVVVWQNRGQYDGDHYYHIFARRYQASGLAVDTSDVQINTQTTPFHYTPVVAMDTSGNYVVAWQSFTPGDNYTSIFTRRYQANGVALDISDVQVNATPTVNLRHPAVAMNDEGDYIVTWESYKIGSAASDVFMRVYDASGVAVDLEKRVNTFISFFQRHSSVATSADGRFVIAWTSGYNGTINQDGSSWGIYAQRYDYISVPVDVLPIPSMGALRAYPNPVSGLLTVENAGVELQLYSLTGRLITDVSFRVLTRATNGDNRTTLDMSGLPEGMYLLTTTLENGEVRQVRVIVR